MSLDKQRKGQLGVNTVERIVLSCWKSRWQSLDAHNDDGFDGLIFIENGGRLSGQIIFVQVKCAKARLDENGRFSVPLNAEKLKKNLTIWRSVVGAVIVVLIDPVDFTAYWTDIKIDKATSPTQIYIPKNQPFDQTAKKDISRLCGTLHRDIQAPTVHTNSDDFLHLRSREHLNVSSRKLYLNLRDTPVLVPGPEQQTVHFDRDGWHHITRPGRNQLVRFQSFVLLGTIRKIIEQHTEQLDFRKKPSQPDSNAEFATIKATVTFPFRHTGIVKVILKRSSSHESGGSKIKFWTIYEPRRKRSTLGLRGQRCS